MLQSCSHNAPQSIDKMQKKLLIFVKGLFDDSIVRLFDYSIIRLFDYSIIRLLDYSTAIIETGNRK
jgi:hypothetical protein